MGNQRQDQPNQGGSSAGKKAQQQQGGARSNSPRTPDEISRGDQDAGTIGSTSGQKEDRERSDRGH